MRKLIVYFLAGIGVLAIAGVGILWLVVGGLAGGESFEEISEFPSPNGTLTAVTYVSIGGGAAGYCNRIVAVTRSTTKLSIGSINKQTANRAFSGSCGSHVSAKWLDDAQLQIEFAGPSVTSGLSVYMNPTVLANAVQARFALVP